MSIHFRQQGSAIIILGNTYAFRDQIKALGGRFNGEDKHWRLPLSDSNLQAIAKLCEAAGGGSLGSVGMAAPLDKMVSSVGHLQEAFPAAGLRMEVRPSVSLQLREEQPLSFTDQARSLMLGKGLSGENEAEGGALLGKALTGSGPQASPNLSVRQLMDQLGQVLNQHFRFPLWITGEVQNLSKKRGNCYFDLAEGREGAHANATMTVRAMIWSGMMETISQRRGGELVSEVLQDGMQIRCLCQVQLYKDRGSISLMISDIDPSFTKGALALQREKLLRELRAKGLDQANKKLQMPAFPLRIGMISADGSRAKSDFLDQLRVLSYPGTVVFAASVMQGEQVPKQVAWAIGALIESRVDLIVLTRGGGSAADLRWFDASEVAYAVAGASVPIIAAIGHHEDVCVAEEICYMRQKTPTAAADFVVLLCQETRGRIDLLGAAMASGLERQVEQFQALVISLKERLNSAVLRSLELRQSRLQQWQHHLQERSTAHLFTADKQLAQMLEQLHRQATQRLFTADKVTLQIGAELSRAAERSLRGFEQQLETLIKSLAKYDPSHWLAQGWTQLRTKGCAILTSVQQVQAGQVVHARLLDGNLDLVVGQVVEHLTKEHVIKEQH